MHIGSKYYRLEAHHSRLPWWIFQFLWRVMMFSSIFMVIKKYSKPSFNFFGNKPPSYKYLYSLLMLMEPICEIAIALKEGNNVLTSRTWHLKWDEQWFTPRNLFHWVHYIRVDETLQFDAYDFLIGMLL